MISFKEESFLAFLSKGQKKHKAVAVLVLVYVVSAAWSASTYYIYALAKSLRALIKLSRFSIDSFTPNYTRHPSVAWKTTRGPGNGHKRLSPRRRASRLRGGHSLRLGRESSCCWFFSGLFLLKPRRSASGGGGEGRLKLAGPWEKRESSSCALYGSPQLILIFSFLRHRGRIRSSSFVVVARC